MFPGDGNIVPWTTWNVNMIETICLGRGGVNPPFMLCKSMYRVVLFVYIIGIIFSWIYVLAAM